MAYYMIQTAFTADAWAKMLKKPQNRAEQVRPMIEKLGGKLEGYWSCFGDYDTVLIVRASDNIDAAACLWPLQPAGRCAQPRPHRC